MKKNMKLYLVLSVCIITPMANNIFVASLPEMAQFFKSDYIEWTMSIFLLGLAIPQLICGALSDQFGRKPVLIGGLIIFCIASFMVPMAHNFTFLLVARFFQAVGACCLIPTTFAIARDVYNREELVKIIGMIMLAIGVFPLISPVIGAWLDYFLDWKSTFYCLLIIGVIFLFIAGFFFDETHTERDQFNFNKLIERYKKVCSMRMFVSYAIVSGCSYAILFAFMASATLIYFNEYDISPVIGGNLIAINGISIVAMGIISPKIALRIGLNRWIFVGTLFLVIGGLCFLFGSLWFNFSFLMVVISMLITSLGVGIIRPIASAAAMQVVEPEISGSASAFFNLVSFLGGAISTGVVGLIDVVTSFEFALITIILGVIACLIIFSISNGRSSQYQEIRV